jgi:hypothetical protein
MSLLSDLLNVRKLRTEHDKTASEMSEMHRKVRLLQHLQALQDQRRAALNEDHPEIHARYFTKDGIAAAKKGVPA